MYPTFLMIFSLFLCSYLVSSQKDLSIRRENDTVSLTMETFDIEDLDMSTADWFRANKVCGDYSTVLVCLNEQVDITCNVHEYQFNNRWYGWRSDFRPYMSVYNRFNKLEDVVSIENGITSREDRSIANDVANDPCYFCWFYMEKGEFTKILFKRRSKAVRAQFYDCNCLQENETVHYNIEPIGASINFTCWHKRLNENVTIEWHLQGATEDEFRSIDSSDESNISNVYHIKSISKRDAGLYKCYVWFHESRVRFSRQFDLRLLMPPLRPVYLEVTNVRDSSVTLTFQGDVSSLKYMPADQTNEQSFQIRYYPFEKFVNNQSMKIIVNDTKVELIDLSPFTLYAVELKQVNTFGESEPIYNVFFTKNSISVGRPFDTEITAILNQPMALKCYNYENVSRGIEWWKFEGNSFKSERDQKTGTYAIQNIDTKHAGLYKCRMPLGEFSELYDFSSLGHNFIIRLSILIPPSSPTDFRCLNNISRGLTLTWTSAVEQNQTDQYFLNAIVDSYKLKHKKVNSAEKWEEKVLFPNKTEAAIENLDSEEYYAVRLSSINKAGESKTEQKICKVS